MAGKLNGTLDSPILSNAGLRGHTNRREREREEKDSVAIFVDTMRPRGRGYLNTCSSFRPNTRKFFDTRDTPPLYRWSSLFLSFSSRATDLRSACLPNRWIYPVDDRSGNCLPCPTYRSSDNSFGNLELRSVFVRTNLPSVWRFEFIEEDRGWKPRRNMSLAGIPWFDSVTLVNGTFATRARTTFNGKSRGRFERRRLND